MQIELFYYIQRMQKQQKKIYENNKARVAQTVLQH